MTQSKHDHIASHGHEEVIKISNEFAEVIIRKVYSRCGERIEIQAPRTDRSIKLDPLECEALTWQQKEVFSEMLKGSNGPPEGEGPLP